MAYEEVVDGRAIAMLGCLSRVTVRLGYSLEVRDLFCQTFPFTFRPDLTGGSIQEALPPPGHPTSARYILHYNIYYASMVICVL